MDYSERQPNCKKSRVHYESWTTSGGDMSQSKPHVRNTDVGPSHQASQSLNQSLHEHQQAIQDNPDELYCCVDK